MISVEEALSRVLQRAAPLESVEAAAGDALHRVLAEDVRSDIDTPPHDKALMDGYAVRASDLREGAAELAVLEEVAAGGVPKRRVTSGAATRIMTGAPIPDGADAVVMIERTECGGDPRRVRIRDDAVAPEGNILRRGAVLRRGELVLRAGRRLGPREIGLLAEAGAVRVRVVRAPRVAVIATGDELTPAERTPGPGQIRNSNGPMLCALVERSGGRAVDLGIVRDDLEELRRRIRLGLEEDILVLSGGVSAGDRDLAPDALRAEGVEQVFHKVRMKPGKPLWFGVAPAPPTGRASLVFGLPGNPASTFVGFELLVRWAMAKMAGCEAESWPLRRASLECEHVHRGDRPTFQPAASRREGDPWGVTPLPWRGSADLRGLAEADCLACFPAGDRTFAAGEIIDVYVL